ncbi:MAG: 30S ribosomal protein S8 [uncultured bacterium]|nr:MAG: 30S ribosomal protein S8 [uncultured bacterium]
MMTDPIADMLTRIRNAYRVRKQEATFPYSKLKMNICEILVREGYLEKAEKVTDAAHPQILVGLKYSNRQPALLTIDRISKPGSRYYVQYEDIKKVLNGFGIAILSTSKGLMTNKEARTAKVGGELICEVS